MKYEVVFVIPDDVVLQILARLPIKSLFRFKSVCKFWYNLISHTNNSSYFVHLFNHFSIQNHPMILLSETVHSSQSKPSFISVDHNSLVSEISLDFLRCRVKIRASCNGLLCCSSIADKGVFYVCNPVTRQFVLLPSTSTTRERRPAMFYPDDEPTLVGLASNLLTLSFHVVLAGYHRSFGRRPAKTFVCFVFDSESGTWRKFVSVQDETFSHMNKNQPVYVNGALHWLTESCSCVLVLNLTRDVWEKILLPDEVVFRSGTLYLLELDGCVSVIQISGEVMNIWMLEDYERRRWNMVDKVSLRCIIGLLSGIFPITQTGECVFLATYRQILMYNRNSKVWKEMYSKNCATFPLWFAAHAFRSTLFPCQ